jgi:hypothetical protein
VSSHLASLFQFPMAEINAIRYYCIYIRGSQVLKAVTVVGDAVQSSETSVNFCKTTRHFASDDNSLYSV